MSSELLDNISSLGKPVFAVRIVVCDYYSAKPVPGIDVIYSEFRGADIKQVPVLRIFGPATDGRKVCLHVHGVFPYFYLPCPTSNPEPQFLYQMAASLDKALNIAMKQATSTNQHVYKITLVKGLPFYGFHDKDHLYLKVFLYNPSLIKKAVELCSNGAILGQTFQPHESHLNFTLQFFIDFNLFGMSNIDLQNISFRKSPGASQKSDDPLDSVEDTCIKPESMCYYEADCAASHIINRQRIGKGDGIENPGLEEVWDQEKKRRQELNMSMASKSLSQGRLHSEETDSHYKFEQIFCIKMASLNQLPVDTSKDIEVTYPAESLEGTQLFDAVDVSIHLPSKSLGASLNEPIQLDSEELDDTLVNEEVALNSSLSLHYSQVLLDSEDLDLLEVLKDMDDKPVEEDSMMNTPADKEKDEDDSDDAEYSQIFNEKTIMLDTAQSKDGSDDTSSWNDSFWDGANIAQLDGTFDNDHVKKVRKRKMRPFKLGLSRPKPKRVTVPPVKEEPLSEVDFTIPDEINASRETISISSIHLKKSLKSEEEIPDLSQASNDSIVELVQRATAKFEDVKLNQSKYYDIEKNFEPLPGPSTYKLINNKNDTDNTPEKQVENDSLESSPDDSDLGFISFYNTSKFNDSMNIEDDNKKIFEETDTKLQPTTKLLNYSKEINSDEDIKLHYSETPVVSTINTEYQQVYKKTTVSLTPKFRAPTKSYIESTFETYKIPTTKNLQPYYSDPKDVGDKIEIGQVVLKLRSNSAHDQKPFEKVLNTTSLEEWRHLLFLQNNEILENKSEEDNLRVILAGNRQCILEPLRKPPTSKQVAKWIDERKNNNDDIKNISNQNKEVSSIIEDLENSQAIGLNEIDSSLSLECDNQEKTNNENLQVTMQSDGSYLCFRNVQSHKEIPESPVVEVNYLTYMVLEVHTSIREDLKPDPKFDEIKALFLNVVNDCPDDHFLQKSVLEIYVVDNMTAPKHFDRCVINKEIYYVKDETEIIQRLVKSIVNHDPDIMCGYEIEMNSWGYVLERCQYLGIDIIPEISRITEKSRQKRWRTEESDMEGKIIGRITFNVWRLFRHELALSSYSFENCMYEILKERVPKYSFAQLDEWWNDETRILRWIPVEHYLTRLSGTVRMMEKLDIIHRTSELARLFGLQWWEVLSRGSQFRVESLMLRGARPLNLIALSPTVKQRAAMRAPECLPLIFEPESRFYADPVIVLDFQSLYPSMMIAYNYCFSTCIGRVQNITGESAYEFGAWRLRVSKAKLEALVKNDLVHWSPVGVGFVKPSVRRGVLPAMLRRILAARQAVKKSMKQQTDETVKKAMHSRQLGLKLIANVTYGYTAANFSGRMPCVEVGDSVVAKGRETLERAIKLVENNKEWNTKVVYGDTDSMFVLVPGGTRKEAFEIGQKIADAVTADNPSPVALKLEKVYQPCILQTKKRYVGYMYESAEQETPVYEAKGIETVRRDGCPAGVKLLQRSLCELFSSGDMSRVKKIAMALLSKLMDGTLPPQELFFTREYNGPNGYKPGAAAPPNEIARRLMSRDPRASPRTGERVAWLVCAGAPALPLVKLARTPEELRKEPCLRPHVAYYVTRVLLPPLHRCLSLLGVNVFKWWNELGYVRESQWQHSGGAGGIARYLWRERCALCGARSPRSLCAECAGKPRRAVAALGCHSNGAMLHVRQLAEICASCCGHNSGNNCHNTECPVLWRKQSAHQKLTQVQDIIRQIPSQLKCDEAFNF